jgi:hypothetical protein
VKEPEDARSRGTGGGKGAGERRFTDRDVALIFQRAAELDRDRGPASLSRGLSLGELQEIGREVGLGGEVVARAAREVAGTAGRGGHRSILGAPLVHRQARAVAGELDREALGALVSRLEETVPAQGTVTEALETVRWHARGRFLGRQVALEPGDGETRIRVEERYTPRARLLLQGIPTIYGALFGAVVGSEMVGPLVGVAGAVAVALAVWIVARVAWGGMARRSGERVHEVAEVLAAAAHRLAEGGREDSKVESDAGPG